MSNYAWMIVIAALLAAFGTFMLAFMTLKYYWGERGTPPLTGEAKKRRLEEELQARAKQIKYVKENPIATRKSSFWDNSKVYKDKNTK